MIKAIVIAASFHQYATYIRNRRYKRDEYLYYGGGDIGQILGFNKQTTVFHLLEGWQENRNLTAADARFISLIFNIENIHFIPERKIYNEGIVF